MAVLEPHPNRYPRRLSLRKTAADLVRSLLAPLHSVDLWLVDPYHKAPAGVSRSAQLFWRLLRDMEWLTTKRILPGSDYPLNLGRARKTLWLANARDLKRTRSKVKWVAERSAHSIGYWYFELDQLPAEEAEASDFLSEIWVASEFVAQAVRRSCSLPVVVIPPPTLLGLSGITTSRPRRPLNRFLISLDAYSSVERKNPWVAAEAFTRVFGRNTHRTLTIRVSRPEGLSQPLRNRLDSLRSKNISVLFKTFSRAEEVREFMASHDVYLSPHRSEGLGLQLLEAILLGMPVIATEYGGNTDFCNSNGVDLIDYGLISGEDPQGFYNGQFRWADPHLDHLCRLLEQLVSRSEEELEIRRGIASRTVLDHFDTKRIEALTQARLIGGQYLL